jgi:hypothetical protein
LKTNKTTGEKAKSIEQKNEIRRTRRRKQRRNYAKQLSSRGREKKTKPEARSEKKNGSERKRGGLTKVEVELLESSAHGPAAGTLRDAAAVLLANEGLHASRTQATYAFGTGVALS